MTKFLYRALGVLVAIALFFVLLFTSLELIVFNMNYFEDHYSSRDIMSTTDMSLEDLMVVTKDMMDYLADKRETLDMQAVIDGEISEVFGEREKGHMVDVKKLFIDARFIRNVSFFVAFLVMGLGAFKKRKMLYEVLGTMKYVFAALLLVAGGVGFLFYTDFNKYFVLFHEIFFDNDLWLLDPRTDILINMVPEAFFFTTVMYWVIFFLSSLIVVGVTGEVVRRKVLKDKMD